MPLLNSTYEDLPILVEFAGATSIESDLVLQERVRSTFSCRTTLIPNLSNRFGVAAEIEGSTELDLFLRLNNETNVFAQAEIESSTEFNPFLRVRFRQFAQVRGKTEVDLELRKSTADSSTFTIGLSIFPAIETNNIISGIQGRLIVDGEELPMISWEFSELEQSIGGQVTVRLARSRDREKFTKNSVVRFGIGQKSLGVWNEDSMDWLIDNINIDQHSRTVGWSDGPNDTISLSLDYANEERLRRTSDLGLILYDPSRQTITSDSIEPIVDVAGRQYRPTIQPVVNLDLYKILNRVYVTECGFSSVRTNIPNYPVQRYDCDMGQRFTEGVSGLIGQFEPLILIRDQVVWILDTNLTLVDDFSSAFELRPSHYQSLSGSIPSSDVDALLVEIVEDKRDYDYITQANESSTEYFQLSNGEEASKTTERQYIEYRKLTNPSVVQKKELQLERVSIFSNQLGTIFESEERITYNSKWQPTLRRKTESARIKVPPSEDFSFQQIKVERETFNYSSHPYKPRLSYLQKRHLEVRGAIVRDNQTLQLNAAFQQDYVTAYRSGNLNEDILFLSSALIKIETEKAEPLRDDQTKFSYFEYDAINDVVVRNEVETRPGDVSIRDTSMQSTKILVFGEDTAPRTNRRIDKIHLGELPIKSGIHLAKRILKRRQGGIEEIQIQDIGYTPALLKGHTVSVYDREEKIGEFIILERSISYSDFTILSNFRLKQLL